MAPMTFGSNLHKCSDKHWLSRDHYFAYCFIFDLAVLFGFCCDFCLASVFSPALLCRKSKRHHLIWGLLKKGYSEKKVWKPMDFVLVKNNVSFFPLKSVSFWTFSNCFDLLPWGSTWGYTLVTLCYIRMQETKHWISKQEASASANKNTVRALPQWKAAPKAISGKRYILDNPKGFFVVLVEFSVLLKEFFKGKFLILSQHTFFI